MILEESSFHEMIVLDNEEYYQDFNVKKEVVLPEDAQSYIPLPVVKDRGAGNFSRLFEILNQEYGFTEWQVATMREEFLYACIEACDPEHAQEIYETWDIVLIRNLLNEKFFDAVGKQPMKYVSEEYYERVFEASEREETLAWLQENMQEYMEYYGALCWAKVYKQIEGTKRIFAPIYTIKYEDGTKEEGLCAADEDGRLQIYQIDSRYYWDDYSLLENLH